MSKKLSQRAYTILLTYLDRKDVIITNFCEKVSHDDYDDLDPKSNIYDFYIYYRKNGKNFVDNWHAEQWFAPDENIEYQFSSNQEIN